MTNPDTPVRPLAAFAVGSLLPGVPVFAFDAAGMVRLEVKYPW